MGGEGLGVGMNQQVSGASQPLASQQVSGSQVRESGRDLRFAWEANTQ